MSDTRPRVIIRSLLLTVALLGCSNGISSDGPMPTPVRVGTLGVNGQATSVCLGGLIDEEVVLTAAHCLITPDGAISQHLLVSSDEASWESAEVRILPPSALRGASGVDDWALLTMSAIQADTSSLRLRFGSAPSPGTVLRVLHADGAIRIQVVENAACTRDGLLCAISLDDAFALCPGDSGAPLLDTDNAAIGVAVGGGCGSDAMVFSLLREELEGLMGGEG